MVSGKANLSEQLCCTVLKGTEIRYPRFFLQQGGFYGLIFMYMLKVHEHVVSAC